MRSVFVNRGPDYKSLITSINGDVIPDFCNLFYVLLLLVVDVEGDGGGIGRFAFTK